MKQPNFIRKATSQIIPSRMKSHTKQRIRILSEIILAHDKFPCHCTPISPIVPDSNRAVRSAGGDN
jgi:hypothetical protein